MTIAVVIPSRGRPERAREAVDAIRDTAELESTRVVLAVDADDPEHDRYRDVRDAEFVTLAGRETGDLVRATNTVSAQLAHDHPELIIGNFGDDHLARTPGWDRLVSEALASPGIAYGRDGIQDAHLPTAPFISAAIVRALGWYAYPRCRHLYIDDVWRDLGKEAGCLRYLPDLFIEHMHPAAQKAEWDPGYERANNRDVIDHDRAAYSWWHRSGRFRRDAATVKGVL